MTDLEINKALALAIGWQESDFSTIPGTDVVMCFNGCKFVGYFDYKNWNVVGPIAERFDCFPNKAQSTKHIGEWYAPVGQIANGVYADTPQKAIALAVIGGVK